MPFAEVNGIRMHYERAGQGEPLILVTGLAGSTAFWNKTVPLLTDSFDVITVDNRGAGITEYSGGFSIEDMADDIVALMDCLGLRKTHLLGWSMGSHISLNLAARYSERIISLTLVSSYLRRPARSAYILNALAESYRNGEISAEMVGRMMNVLLRTSGYFDSAEKAGRCINCPDPGPANGMYDQMSAVEDYDPSLDAGRITVPTLSVHGMEDIMTEPVCGDDLADRIPGCRRIRVPEEGHILRPESYIPAFREFVFAVKSNTVDRMD